jgi:hypothetical protein
MAVGHPHVGDVHVVRVTVRESTDGPIVPLVGPVTFRLRRPDGTTFDVDANLTTDGSDGQAEYQTLGPSPADLDQGGTWTVQLKDADGPWHADVKTFIVLDNLAEPT